MEGCLRSACPCLRSLWDRIYKSSEMERKQGSGGGVTNPVDCLQSETRYSDPIRPPQREPPPPPPKPPNSTPPAVRSEVYMALWAFEARDNEELSFKAGDRFRIIKRNSEWWCAAKLDLHERVTATGFVPHNYLERAEWEVPQPWFFGKMSRIECLSHLLADQNADGAFLVRLSETGNVGQVLSVKLNNKAKHFKILQSESGFFIEQSHCFPSLVELIEYYKLHYLASLCKLGKPCIRKEPHPQDLSHSTVDEWELPKEDFTLDQKLGSGFFADVYRGKWKNHTNVAIKVLKNNGSPNQQQFHMEVEVLKRLRHNHLIALFATCTSSAPYYIITEYMEKGNLQDFLRSDESKTLDSEILIDMAYQVADGMTYLEEHNSIHRDLAARNVLVGEGYLCKVADFGLARFIKDPIYLSNDKNIPYKWTAPEAITHGHFSIKSDVWSFGILLYEIFTFGGIPYPGQTANEVIRDIIHKGYRLPAPPKCPGYIYTIMASCWKEKPEERPDFKTLKSKLMECINCYINMN